jgi:hypothetical protein
MNNAKTAILVTVIALLIWAFAEGESLQTQRTIAELEVPSRTDGLWAAEVLEGQGWRGRVEVVLEGPTASLDVLDSVLRRPLRLEPGDEGLPRRTGEFTVDLRMALRAHPELRARGVTVVSAEPAALAVRVQELATVAVPVRVEAPDAELDGPAELLGISEASVLVAAGAVSSLSGNASVIARVTPEDLQSLQERVRSTVRVRLTPGPAFADVQVFGVEPTHAEVRLTVRSRTATVVLPTVPVDVRMPAGELERWEVRIPPEERVLRDVTVTGPSDLIEEIRTGSRQVWAYVRLSYDDLESRITSQRVEFTAYPTSLTFSAEDLIVELEIERREEGGGGG